MCSVQERTPISVWTQRQQPPLLSLLHLFPSGSWTVSSLGFHGQLSGAGAPPGFACVNPPAHLQRYVNSAPVTAASPLGTATADHWPFCLENGVKSQRNIVKMSPSSSAESPLRSCFLPPSTSASRPCPLAPLGVTALPASLLSLQPSVRFPSLLPDTWLWAILLVPWAWNCLLVGQAAQCQVPR